MRDVITMWRHTRMVVLVALIAAVYAAVLIPFKVAVPIAPGFTEFRPANVIPIVCSLLFGPAAAWGAAIGNLIGDAFGGTLGPGSFFGFIGNFFYGFLPYKLWGRMGFLSSKAPAGATSSAGDRGRRWLLLWGVPFLLLEIAALLFYLPSLYPTLPLSKDAALTLTRVSAFLAAAAVMVMIAVGFKRRGLEFFLVTLAACLACAVIVGWGVDLLGFLPFAFIGNVVFINNLAVTLVIGPALMAALYPRARRWGLLYTDILDEAELRPRRLAWAGVGLVWVAVVAGFVLGNLISLHLGGHFLGAEGAKGATELARTVAVPVGVLVLGSLLL